MKTLIQHDPAALFGTWFRKTLIQCDYAPFLRRRFTKTLNQRDYGTQFIKTLNQPNVIMEHSLDHGSSKL